MARLINSFEQFFDAAGNPLVSGKLFFFETGSSTMAKDTFSDVSETIANSNPVILGGDGRCPNVFGSGSYRVVLTDSDEVQIVARDPVGGDQETTFGADWNSLQTYSENDVVRDDGKYWISLVSANQGNQPSIDGGTNWTQWPNVGDLDGYSGKNLLFGNFRVNQRAVTGTVVLSAGGYGHDRFRGGSSGCTYTFNTVGSVTTITISAGTLEQEVEGANIAAGNHVLSWAGSSQGRIDGGTFGVSGSVIASLTSGVNSTVEWNAGTLSLTQLEIGSVSTEFDNRPIGEELSLCQRFFFRLDSGVFRSIGAVQTAIQFNTTLTPPVEMRIAPSFSASTGFRLSIQSGGSLFTDFQLSTAVTTRYGLEIAVSNVAAGMTIGFSGMAVCTAGQLDFSSEL